MSATPRNVNASDRSSAVSRRTMLTVSAAAGLSGLCAAYAGVTRPLLRQAEVIDRQPFRFDQEPLRSQENVFAQRYLPDQPWAAKAAYTVHNGQSLLFFNTWEPAEQGTAARLEPFAIVFPPRPDQPDQEPLTVVGEAAILRVAGSIELANADPGRITSISVPGPVRLRGPDGLDLQGRHFTYDENSQLLWSDEEVTFRHSTRSGRGRGIELQLFRVGPPDAFESIAVSGVQTLRLRNDVEMDLQIDSDRGGPFGNFAADAGTNSNEGTDAAPPPPTRVTCAGAFTFDLNRNVATFVDSVVASRAGSDGQLDSLACDVLEVHFEPSTPEAKLAAAERRAKVTSGTLTPDDGFQTIDADLDVTRLVATGEQATLRSPSNDFVATLSQLTYDAATGVTSLMRTDDLVKAQQGASILRSPQIDIVPKENGPPEIVCLGKGKLQHFDPPETLVLEARWSQSLRRLRAEDGLDLIRLNGLAQVEQPLESFRLDADNIDLWLDPQEDEVAPAEAAPSLVGSGRMEPRRLIAETTPGETSQGLVMLRSPEIAADSQQLDVIFVAPPDAASTTRREQRSSLVTVSQRVEYAAATQPAGPPAAPPPEPQALDQPQVLDQPATVRVVPSPAAAPSVSAPVQRESVPHEPIEVVADRINVVVERAGDESSPAATSPSGAMAGRGGQVREVHTSGNVVVRQRRGAGEEPLFIEGDRLDLFNRGEGQELVHIYGTEAGIGSDGQPQEERPARVHDQGADLFGLNINLDRRENRAWVEGKGVLELPAKGVTGALSLDGETPDETTEPAEPERLTVWWADRMNFDGDRAIFYGKVQTILQSNFMTCEEMEVRLTERFDFAAAGRTNLGQTGDSQRPEVAHVHCRHRVQVAGKELEAGKLVERRQAEFYEFTLDQQTGATSAIGPGHIAIWRRGDGNRASLAAENSASANVPLQPGTPPWEYVFVRFNGSSIGNVRHRTTTFHDKVRVVYGPVVDEWQTIDPDRPDRGPEEAGWMTCEKLTLTQHKKTETAAAYSDVLAEQNVRIAGRGFSGEADQVIYDESKGQYVLKAFGNRVATIQRKAADGSGSGGGSGQVISFWPARMHWDVVKAEGFDGFR